MTKPTVYLDTSVISAYWYEGSDVAMRSRRLHTREWWELERPEFKTWGSAFVEAELRAGKFRRQAECLRFARRLPYLAPTSRVRQMMDEILARGIVPANKPANAAHLAIATVHEMDDLVTWNYAHMANPAVQARMQKLTEELNCLSPLLVSPESIPQVRFGQTIRRSKEP